MSDVELREAGGKLILEGHASTFSRFYELAPGVREEIMPLAFQRTL